MQGGLSISNAKLSVANYSNVHEYIRYVNSIPMLTLEEEVALLTEFANGNQKSGKKVAEAHLRLVIKTALEFKSYYSNLWDIIAEGNIGLLMALRNFSLKKDVRFSTYAMLWIKSSIQEFILKSSSILKISIGAVQKKIMFNLGKVKKALEKYKSQECTNAQIADILQVPESEIIYITDALASKNSSLDAKTNDDSGGTLQDITASEIQTPEEIHSENAEQKNNALIVKKSLAKLNERERFVIVQRFLAKNVETLSSIAKKLGVSVERVRQIEGIALKKMRTI
jgi:RNA polymerase sigma-32 factor